MDSSKYKITQEIKWMDNLGRWVAIYRSAVYPIENVYLLTDGNVYEEKQMAKETEDVLNLNFWFLCYQYEQKLTVDAAKAGQVSSNPEVVSNA